MIHLKYIPVPQLPRGVAMPKVAKINKVKTSYVFVWEEKTVGYIWAHSEKQAWHLWLQGYGRHLYPGLCQVESILDRVKIKARSPVAA